MKKLEIIDPWLKLSIHESRQKRSLRSNPPGDTSSLALQDWKNNWEKYTKKKKISPQHNRSK